MTVAATILVPTHDHGPMLLRSVGSALAQTVEELEVFVIGDGVPDVTREVMAELGADERVRFFDHPKGLRHGELYRHAALGEARGEIVCYLSDDDLYLPGQVEEMRVLLAEHDFAHALPVSIAPDGHARNLRVDLGLDFYRRLLLEGENRIPFSCGAHTLELYRRLPDGWRTTPTGIHTDLYMWQQILALPGCRAASGTRPTVLHFPSPERADWSMEQRLAELDEWSSRLSDSVWQLELTEEVLAAVAVDDAALEEAVRVNQQGVDWLRDVVSQLEDDRQQLNAQLLELDSELKKLDSKLRELDRELTVMTSSVTWRLRGRLLRLPGLALLLRWAAKALAGRAAPGTTEPPHPAPTREESSRATESPAPDQPSDSRARHSDPSTQ